MRTTLNIDEKLIEEITVVTGERNKGKAVNKALEEYVRNKRLQELKALAGHIDIVDNLDELEELELEELKRLYGDR